MYTPIIIVSVQFITINIDVLMSIGKATRRKFEELNLDVEEPIETSLFGVFNPAIRASKPIAKPNEMSGFCSHTGYLRLMLELLLKL